MIHPALGEFLILFLLLFNASRIFFVRYGALDSLSLLAPLCLTLSVLQIAAWNADIFSVVIFLLSLLSFFTNFRAVQRFAAGLFIDYFSAAFKTGAVLVMLLAAATGAALIYFRPLNIGRKKTPVKRERILVSGALSSGVEIAAPFSVPSGALYVYRPLQKADDEKPVVLFVSDKRADNLHYEPYLYALSARGYTVYSGDFYAPDVKWYRNALNMRIFRRQAMILEYLLKRSEFEAQKDFFSFNSLKELETLRDFVKKNGENAPVFVVGDWMAEDALKDFLTQHPDEGGGAYMLTMCADYQSAGWGCIEITDPFLHTYLGFKKNTSGDFAEQMARATAEQIEAALAQKNKENA